MRDGVAVPIFYADLSRNKWRQFLKKVTRITAVFQKWAGNLYISYVFSGGAKDT